MGTVDLTRRGWLRAAAGLSAAAVLPRFQRVAAAAQAAPPAVLDIGSRLEPLVDRYLIDSLDGARLVLQRPVPAGVALRFDARYEGPFSGCITVLHDQGVYRMYYRGKPTASPDGKDEVTCYAESRDGVTFTKPALNLSPVGPNVILDSTLGIGHNFAPFVDANPSCPADQRYKAVAGLHATGIFAFGSADGVRWRKLSQGPIITSKPFAFDSQNVAFWSERERCYALYFRTWKQAPGESGMVFRWVSRSTSPDFLRWSEPVEMDMGGAPPEHLYTQQTHPYFRAPQLYISLAARFWPGKRALSANEAQRIGVHPQYSGDVSDAVLMTSRGGHRYDRTFLESFLRPGLGAENWVSRTNYPALGVVPTGAAEMSLYAHRNYAQPTSHAGRFTLRTDGFASVSAPYVGGELRTKPIAFSGKELTLNYSTSAAGSIRVEIQNAEGNAIPGYALAESQELCGDRIEHVVAWKSGSDLGRLAGQPVRLRFVLKDADLFALRFRPPRGT